MYNHFVCQLSDTRLMDSKKKYKEQTQIHYPANTSWKKL